MDRVKNGYELMVEEFIRLDSPMVFGNKTREHARFIIRHFIESAKERIEILSGSCFSDFYRENGFFEALGKAARAITKPGSIRIITVEDKSYLENGEQIAKINSEVGCDVIRLVPCWYKSKETARPIPHFIVVDGKRYRQEEPHEPGSIEVKAEVCCNDKIKAGRLSFAFDHIWEKIHENAAPANA